jgi:hypothetical protein
VSDIIDLLERLGQDARLRRAPQAEIERHLQNADVSADVRAAFMARDQRRIEALLGVDSNICCLIYMPKEAPEEESPGKVNPPMPAEEEWVPAYNTGS